MGFNERDHTPPGGAYIYSPSRGETSKHLLPFPYMAKVNFHGAELPAEVIRELPGGELPDQVEVRFPCGNTARIGAREVVKITCAKCAGSGFVNRET